MALVLAAVLLVAACGSSSVGRHHLPHPSPTASRTTDPIPTGCTPRGDLPDPTCTPGKTDPAVTQANIHKTICVPGYSRRARPPLGYTRALKRTLIASYGDYAGTSPSRYELDHLIPLSYGGDPRSPQNLWPESPASPNGKDVVEFAGYQAICAGKIPLAQAQAEIAADWHKFATEPAVAAYLGGGASARI